VIVQVKLFATLRRQYPKLDIGEAMPVELAEGTTVGQLIIDLELPSDEVKVVFVNGIVQDRGHTLVDGDEVGIFPTVGGG
jgi:molybdopterin synthase sulfur carrier subunit